MHTRTILMAGGLIILMALPCPAAEWEKLPPLPEPNGGFACAALGEVIVVAGGTNWEGGVKNWLDAIHIFSPKTQSWRQAGRLPSPQAYAVSGVVEDENGWPQLVIKGGTMGERTVPEWRSLNHGGAQTVMDIAPHPRVLAAGGIVNGWLVQVGGTNDPANLAGLVRAALLLKPGDGLIDILPDYPGAPFGTAACTVAAAELFIFGGANWDASAKTVRNAVEAHALHVAKRAWRPLKHLPCPVRGLAAVDLGNGSLYLAGGYKSDMEGFTAEAWFYDIAKDEYKPAKPLPYSGMVNLVVCKGHLYCLGGEDRQKSRTNACYRIGLPELEVK